MKHLVNRLAVIMGLLFLFTGNSFATNSFLEESQNYSVIPKGNGVVHFKIPIWAYGRVNNYRWGSPSNLWYHSSYAPTPIGAVTMFMYIRSTDTQNTDDKNMPSTVDIRLEAGTVKVTRTSDGGTKQIDAGTGFQTVEVPAQASIDGEYKRVVYLEFDWYLPQELTNKQFYTGVAAMIYKYDVDDTSSHTQPSEQLWYCFPDRLDGADDIISPELQSPYVYMMDNNAKMREGKAAVPYVVYQTPKSYTTSKNTTSIMITNRSGVIVVPTTDSVQKNFYATFTVQPNADISTTVQRKTNTVDIPAYHRIWGFKASQVLDEQGSYNGANKLVWTVNNSEAEDLVPTDYFEIQRATNYDYTDAQTISIIPMERGKGVYEYIDNTRINSGGAATTNDTTGYCKTLRLNDYVLRNADGVAMCKMDVKMIAKTLRDPSATVYYRVRRTSAANWYWSQNPFVKYDELLKLNYLAPLAQTQADYTKDKDFDTNHKVHFNVKIDNAVIKQETAAKKDCYLEVDYKEFTGSLDSVTVTVLMDDEVMNYCTSAGFYCTASPFFSRKLSPGVNVLTMPIVGADNDCYVQLQPKTEVDGKAVWINEHSTRFRLMQRKVEEEIDGSTWYVIFDRRQPSSGNGYFNVIVDGVVSNDRGENSYARRLAEKRWKEVEDQVLQQLYDSLNNSFNPYSLGGRCIWDRGAQLILMRTMKENNATIEMIVPQDSIRRNADGSWSARFTDVANQACTNYSYQVRIDPSSSDLQFQNNGSKEPMTIQGPDLYFNEAATISSFTASQGDARREWKRGILLQWIPSSAAVDEYELYRVLQGSSSSPRSIYRGLDNSYVDTTAVPGAYYEYTLVARYECKGKKTEHSATAVGWRTPYGEISGRILQIDNSGMAGVQVSLSANGQTLETIVTDAAGAYLFDSLAYDATWGTNYTVSVTSQYGTFSYHDTPSASAAIALGADKCVVRNVDFVNTSCVRLTGRVLYHMTTIPVSGACFILNGDTIRRANSIYTSGIDGNFELTIPKSMPCRLRVAKAGHTFLNDGWLFVTGTDTTFSLVKALDGVRFYDQTKVRLVGRVAGGVDQQQLPPALGLGKNNLGDNLQLVLMLEGDNTAHIVHDPDDLTRDTLQFAVDNLSGHTATIYEKKRIIIRPDSKTGEYAVDLFPVKYKVVQATAKGYASLLDAQAGVPSFDLTAAPLAHLHSDTLNRHASFNARFDRIYRNPMQIGVKQYMYGMVQEGFGEEKILVSSFLSQPRSIQLYARNPNGEMKYLFGYPIFQQGRTYQYLVGVYEDYYYNNDPAQDLDRVRLRGGKLKVFNGFKKENINTSYPLDEKGEMFFSVEVDNLNLLATGTNALRSLDLSVEREGYSTNFQAIRGFVTGNVVERGDIRTAEADIKILDILRDPPGSGSSCTLEKGATYKTSSTANFSWQAGWNMVNTLGTAYDQSVGVITAATYSGVSTEAGKTYSFSIPIVISGKYTKTTNYTYTTTENISTSAGLDYIGAPGDVFVGYATEVLYGTIRAVRVIDDSTYNLRRPAIDAGFIKEIAVATGDDGKRYHFVIAKETVLGSQMGTQFAYTQGYIEKTLLPKLLHERNALIVNAKDSAEAQQIANARGKSVYWNKARTDDEIGTEGSYQQILPKNVGDYNEPDKVALFNEIILRWVGILANNEKEKVVAIQSGKWVDTYSVSGGTTYSHSESYTADWTSGGNLGYGGFNMINALSQKSDGDKVVGKNVNEYLKAIEKLISQKWSNTDQVSDAKKAMEVKGKVPGMSWKIDFDPVLEISGDGSMDNSGNTISRKIGFTIAPDSYGYTTVSVYRAPVDSIFDKQVVDGLKVIIGSPGKMEEYGPFVFFQQGGSSHCPYEGEVRTKWYFPGQFVLGNATLPIENPKLTMDRYTVSNVPADQAAVFKLTLMNDNLNTDGRPAKGQYFSLAVEPQTNPDGAIILIDGAPLTSASTLTFFCEPGVPIVKTLQVKRGVVDDYEDLAIKLASTTCSSIGTIAKFSVHFTPQASPVQVSFPRDKWVMNTLSAHDSIGYYLPISIDGFDINHKNFDHIEFQYKLSTENNDAWVNQCSFFADDSLYNLATGNKAMIVNGRIEPFRFYGDRDPKELNYDLRAVAYCRYGSGFVTKASPVVSGIKDTRPPVLFGKAQPANGILTIEDNISLRFSEPIAGNWLDEDNNFQILGVTNATGITQTTSPYFDGQPRHYARTQAKRELAFTDLSIDMLIKPAEKNREMVLLAHGDERYNFTFSLTADNRLKLTAIDDGEVRDTKLSKPMDALSTTDFTRVLMVHNFYDQSVRFYAGTKDITEDEHSTWLLQNDASPIVVGAGLDSTHFYHGNMMEIRVWNKPLTPAEISNTHLRRLTGFEYGLLDYYPMNESKGEEFADLATGATLQANGLTWTMPQGISLAAKGKAIQLEPTLFSRTEAEDYSLLFWFRSTNRDADSVSLFGTSMGDSVTMEIVLYQGAISYRAGEIYDAARAELNNGLWHQCALVVSKTFNTASLAIDGEKRILFPAIPTGALSGAKMWLAKGLEGNIDDVCLFEQALPDELVAEFGKQSPSGEEMGLINLLTFSQQKRNSASVMELVFSPNNQRVFKDANGSVIHKEQALLIGDYSANADKINTAPVSDRGLLTALPFSWNYQLSELMINIKAQPREINKRTMYLTVRDVEDVNGNRLPSPVMWTVYADLNSVVWSERRHQETLTDEDTYRFHMDISNTTGMTRQFAVNHLPDWLSVSPGAGTLEAKEEKTLTFTVSAAKLKIGTHHNMIYLTDDQGLAEPLLLELTKKSEPPYADVDIDKYPYNMSLCGRVFLEEEGKTVINTDENDLVYALCKNECVGVAHCTRNGDLYLTIHGNDQMARKQVRFQLWKAATGKVYNLTPNRTILFAHGSVYGCTNDGPIQLTAGENEMQPIPLSKGWNWISTRLAVPGSLQTAVAAEQSWHEGDMIKNPATRQFSTYSEQKDGFVGTLDKLHYSQMYMTYTATENTMHVYGDKLSKDSMRVTLRGNGQWSVLPCLYDQVTLLRDALGDYLDYASTGDIIKSHNRFATFSADRRWVGDLTALTPGEGYLIRRLGAGTVTVNFYNSVLQKPRKVQSDKVQNAMDAFSNPNAATNMTMIAAIADLQSPITHHQLYVYIGDELVGEAAPMVITHEQSSLSQGEALYFLTIQSDAVGAPLRFMTEDGTLLSPAGESEEAFGTLYVPDTHHGTLKAPVKLIPDEINAYKVIENNHVVIIRNNERYDVTGKKQH